MKKDPTVMEAKRYEIYSCSQDASLLEACRLMVEEDISSLVLKDEQGCLAGILTRTDLLRACAAGENWRQKTVRQFMNPDVITVIPESTLSEVRAILLEHQIHRVVVVRQEGDLQRPMAVVSDSDLIYHMLHAG